LLISTHIGSNKLHSIIDSQPVVIDIIVPQGHGILLKDVHHLKSG
jgi:hypothetical protein